MKDIIGYYTLLFTALNAEPKCLVENFKFCMCDPYDIFNILIKIEKFITKFFFMQKEKKAFEVKSKFSQLIQRTSIFTHYIQN